MIWGVLWLVTFKPAWQRVRETLRRVPKIGALDRAFLGLFGIVMPVVYLFLYT